MLFYSLATYGAPVYNKVIPYPTLAIALAWMYGISSALPVPGYAAYLLFYRTKAEPLSLKEVSKVYQAAASNKVSGWYFRLSTSVYKYQGDTGVWIYSF